MQVLHLLQPITKRLHYFYANRALFNNMSNMYLVFIYIFNFKRYNYISYKLLCIYDNNCKLRECYFIAFVYFIHFFFNKWYYLVNNKISTLYLKILKFLQLKPKCSYNCYINNNH